MWGLQDRSGQISAASGLVELRMTSGGRTVAGDQIEQHEATRDCVRSLSLHLLQKLAQVATEDGALLV